MKSIAELKREAAEFAADKVKSGTVVGLGSGSTAAWAVKRIGARLAEGELKDIVGIPTSLATQLLAESCDIPLTTFDSHIKIDLTIDGADEVDREFNLIKGGGGALYREKIVAQITEFEMIIVDENKMVPRLGTDWAVPIEVVPFGWQTQVEFLTELGGDVRLRHTADGEVFYTDQQNVILDTNFGPIEDCRLLADRLKRRTGIVDHGLFIDLTHAVVVAKQSGIEYLEK
ncbi:MAG: ribose-5-phosphate isomerase RpiA [Chloroflexota bacterium]